MTEKKSIIFLKTFEKFIAVPIPYLIQNSKKKDLKILKS